MTEFILQYWVQVSFGIIVTTLGAMAKHLKCEYDSRREEQEVQVQEQETMKTALKAILMGHIHSLYIHHEKLGYMDYNSRRALEALHKPYKDLDGNSVADDYVRLMKNMPTGEGEKNESTY